MRSKSPCVYIMANFTPALYTGVTSDLYTCVWQHKFQPKPHSFAGELGCTRLVYFAEFSRMDDAIAFEKKVKGKKRAYKIALIEGMNPAWVDLAEDWFE